MKIAITGHEGLVGTEILRQHPEYGILDCDITKPDQVKKELQKVNPDLLIHCAALTDVGECEVDEKKAFDVNVGGVRNLIDWFTRGTLIYLSTDHVFDGSKYWAYSEKHTPNPINVYGRTKHMGESMAKFGSHNAVVVRTSRLFDYAMIKNDLECLSSGMPIDFTDRIYRSFIHVEHFVNGLLSIIEKIDNKEFRIEKKNNTINIAGKDRYTYYQFWFLVAREFGIPLDLIEKRTKTFEELGIEADPRPFRCGLNIRKADKLGIPIYSANDGIRLIKEQLDE